MARSVAVIEAAEEVSIAVVGDLSVAVAAAAVVASRAATKVQTTIRAMERSRPTSDPNGRKSV